MQPPVSFDVLVLHAAYLFPFPDQAFSRRERYTHICKCIVMDTQVSTIRSFVVGCVPLQVFILFHPHIARAFEAMRGIDLACNSRVVNPARGLFTEGEFAFASLQAGLSYMCGPGDHDVALLL